MISSQMKDKILANQRKATQMTRCIEMVEDIEHMWTERRQEEERIAAAISEVFEQLTAGDASDSVSSEMLQTMEEQLSHLSESASAWKKDYSDFYEDLTAIKSRIEPEEQEDEEDEETILSIPLTELVKTNETTQENSLIDQEPQVFRVKLEDGTETDAELLTVVEIDGIRYAVYSIENKNGTVDILASYVFVDDEGYDYLSDITNPSDKEKVSQYIRSLIE